MKLTPLLLLSLVGGYAFSTIWTASLYHSARESGHRLYFRAIFYAVFLLTCAFLIHIILYAYVSQYPFFLQFIANVFGTSDEITIWSSESKLSVIFLSFLLGPALGIALNFSKLSFLANLNLPKTKIYPFLSWERFLLNHAIKNNDFEKLIARSFYQSMPMLLTLKTGKVYAGWAVRAPNPIEHRRAIRILPLMSGYRKSETQEVVFVTDYYDILKKSIDPSNADLEHMELGDFEVVLPSDQICSAHLFDLETYAHFLKTNFSAKSNS